MSFLFEDVSSSIPQGFIYDNASDLEAKIIAFRNAGTGQLQLVLDFDRTLTEKSDENSTSWQLMRNHLPPKGKREAQAVYEHYRALEVAEKLTPEDATIWWTTSMSIVAKYRLDMNIVEQEFLSYSTIRPGTKELFDLCAKYNIPTVIMSAGIKDIIDIWCRAYDIHPTIILSTELILNEQNQITGWNETSVVDIFTKHEVDHPELSRIRAERPHTILAGDSLHDHNMAEGTDTVLRVRIVDSIDESDIRKQLEQETFTEFDTIIEDGTLNPIIDLIKQIIK
ncbi:hypothetical protein EPN95_00515 [Patescibacteria group bacterium]|nr:MAG: hypothetical protein EPN95_00515 [Patescibacteria group bacterium]